MMEVITDYKGQLKERDGGFFLFFGEAPLQIEVCWEKDAGDHVTHAQSSLMDGGMTEGVMEGQYCYSHMDQTIRNGLSVELQDGSDLIYLLF